MRVEQLLKKKKKKSTFLFEVTIYFDIAFY